MNIYIYIYIMLCCHCHCIFPGSGSPSRERRLQWQHRGHTRTGAQASGPVQTLNTVFRSGHYAMWTTSTHSPANTTMTKSRQLQFTCPHSWASLGPGRRRTWIGHTNTPHNDSHPDITKRGPTGPWRQHLYKIWRNIQNYTQLNIATLLRRV